jgi:amicoumacin kinase
VAAARFSLWRSKIERYINEALTPSLLKSACVSWDADPERCRLLGDFENFVYEVEVRGRPAVLRITHRSHRTANDVQAELDFVRFLAQRELPVCRPVPSRSGTDWQPLGDEFFACCFERAEGKPAEPEDPSSWNERVFDNWGGTLASFHQSAAEYAPLAGRPQRFRWHEDDLTVVSPHLPAEDADIAARLNRLLAELNRLPRPPESYGLIHADLHTGNFFVSEAGELRVFDFDDACQHWFSYDLAVVINHLSRQFTPAERDRIFNLVLVGYSRVRALPVGLDTELPLLLRLRNLQLYQLMHKKHLPVDRDEGWHERAAKLARRIRAEDPLG